MKDINVKDVENSRDNLTEKQKATFLNGSAIKPISLEKGDVLWRFGSENSKGKIGAYWITPAVMGSIMRMIHDYKNFSEKGKTNVIRETLAILYEFSSLDYRFQYVFREPVIAYKGKTGPQKHFKEDKKLSSKYNTLVRKAQDFRIGGFEQIVIPRFANGSEKVIGRYGSQGHQANI